MTSSKKFAIRRLRKADRDASQTAAATPPPRIPSDLVVGVLVGPHGITGEIKLRPLTEFPERLSALKTLRLRFRNGDEVVYPVKGSRWHKEMLLVRLEGIPHREAAEAVRDAQVVVSVEDAAPLPEGRFYEHQLIGLRVVTPEGEELGRISDIMHLPSNDVYVAGSVLIPATHDAIVRMDPAEGVVVVRSRAYLEGEEVR
jgi:16S rRNA processing protein RimM